jgi:hypothetical protein
MRCGASKSVEHQAVKAHLKKRGGSNFRRKKFGMAGLARWLKVAMCRIIGIVAKTAGYGLIVYAYGIVLVQCMLWLEDGHWPDMQLRIVWYFLGLTEDRLPWLGVEKIRTWILDQPLSIGLLSAGVLVVSAGTLFDLQAELGEGR